jgi:hypothetical protein
LSSMGAFGVVPSPELLAGVQNLDGPISYL